MGCVDFNWPQHFQSWSAKEAKAALEEVGLVAGAVCLRYPSKFARGAMIHPDVELRREAIELTKKAGEVARQLGCNEVVVWSACKFSFDGNISKWLYFLSNVIYTFCIVSRFLDFVQMMDMIIHSRSTIKKNGIKLSKLFKSVVMLILISNGQ